MKHHRLELHSLTHFFQRYPHAVAILAISVLTGTAFLFYKHTVNSPNQSSATHTRANTNSSDSAEPSKAQRIAFNQTIAANSDPRRALARVLAQSDPVQSRQQLDYLIKRYGTEEVERLLAWAKDLPPHEGQSAMVNALLAYWLKEDPIKAAEYARQLPPSLLEEAVARKVVETLALGDPAIALAFVCEMPAAPVREELVAQVLPDWSQANWESAQRWALGLQEGSVKRAALISLSEQWRERDPQGLLEFACTLPEGHGDLLCGIAGWLAAETPEVAADWAARLPPGNDRNRSIETVASMWAARSPFEAAVYATELEPGTARTWAVLAVVRAWAKQSPTEVAIWVSDFSPSPLRDQSLQLLQAMQAESSANRYDKTDHPAPPETN